MKIKQLPYSQPYLVREKFVKKYNALPDDQKESQKAIIQNEFNAAIAEYESDILKQRETIKQENLQAFLEDPKGVLKEIDETRGQAFDIGEELISYGIATATIKRFGKGHLIGKGTIGEHTCSNFSVTAKIGTHTLTREIAGSNDRRDKDRSMALTACQLAIMISDQK